ncbi:hypothetical protein BKA65DRAFT_481037 [Rhexocercosporidium sp. MPI-PUGE-AT-0058]|nr:hypothetical protein BKA65DRAFT_481037 [Rhexocercosporidium sp. MPI-PUGE-AT-0058]
MSESVKQAPMRTVGLDLEPEQRLEFCDRAPGEMQPMLPLDLVTMLYHPVASSRSARCTSMLCHSDPVPIRGRGIIADTDTVGRRTLESEGLRRVMGIISPSCDGSDGMYSIMQSFAIFGVVCAVSQHADTEDSHSTRMRLSLTAAWLFLQQGPGQGHGQSGRSASSVQYRPQITGRAPQEEEDELGGQPVPCRCRSVVGWDMDMDVGTDMDIDLDMDVDMDGHGQAWA